ncbi:hypothetical protein JCM3766R1_000202 [Sporobolomyces carnicolor]
MPPKTDANRAAHELALKPYRDRASFLPPSLVFSPDFPILLQPTFWWIGLVTEAFLAACVALNIVEFSVAFTWQKKIELGDIMVIRAHDAEQVAKIYGSALAAGNGVGSKLMWLSWDLINDIKNMHDFSDLPKEVQDRILQESVHVLETGRIAALGKDEQM